MYSESDIEAAITSGALTPQAAAALRASVAASREAPAVDEESFRLLTGFNDISSRSRRSCCWWRSGGSVRRSAGCWCRLPKP